MCMHVNILSVCISCSHNSLEKPEKISVEILLQLLVIHGEVITFVGTSLKQWSTSVKEQQMYSDIDILVTFNPLSSSFNSIFIIFRSNMEKEYKVTWFCEYNR